MDGLLAFGDVFCIGDKEYVFLGAHQNLIYAALICSRPQTEQLVHMHDRIQAAGTGTTKLNENRLYCFVILTTEQFEGRAAHLANPAMEPSPRIQKDCSLSEADIAQLKQEIRASRGVPNALKEIVGNL